MVGVQGRSQWRALDLKALDSPDFATSVRFHCSSSFTLRSQKRHSLASIRVNYTYNKLPAERIKSPPYIREFPGTNTTVDTRLP